MSSSTSSTSAKSGSNQKQLCLSYGRIVNLVTLVLHFVIFLTALCVVGTVSRIHLDYVAALTDLGVPSTNCCPFFTQVQVNTGTQISVTILGGENGMCVWMIVGSTITVIAMIVFGITTIVKIILDRDIGIISTVVELVAIIVLLVLSFCVAVPLAAGLNSTCASAEAASYSCQGNDGCLTLNSPFDSSRTATVCWYAEAEAAVGASWAVLCFLLIFLVVTIVRLVLWVRRSMTTNSRSSGSDQQESKSEKPAII